MREEDQIRKIAFLDLSFFIFHEFCIGCIPGISKDAFLQGQPLVRIGFPLFDRHHLHRQPIIGYQGVINLVTMLVNTVLDELKAEGIETERELAVLRSLGVQFGQGYLLARPAFPPGPRLLRAEISLY